MKRKRVLCIKENGKWCIVSKRDEFGNPVETLCWSPSDAPGRRPI
jgi:hypothetical protein